MNPAWTRLSCFLGVPFARLYSLLFRTPFRRKSDENIVTVPFKSDTNIVTVHLKSDKIL